MNLPIRTGFKTLVATCFSAASAVAAPADLLINRPLSQSITELSAAQTAAPDDQAVRYALGVAQFCRGVEKLAGSMHEHGLLQTGVTEALPFARMPVPPNPKPAPITAEKFDAMLAEFVTDLATAEKTLSGVNDPNVKLPLKVGLIQLDLNGAAPGGEMSAWQFFEDLRSAPEAKEEIEKFYIGFDLGDVHWFRGYSHLLCGIAEIMQAYDKQQLFERTGHLLFAGNQSPYPFLRNGEKVFDILVNVDAADVIAFIHLWNFPLKDGAKMKSARQHLLATFDCSDESWKAILAETDNDAEWIPNANQQTVMPGLTMTDDIIKAWRAFIADGRDVLEGRRLIPFWRGSDGRGVNFKKVFEEPREFDLVLWVQGTAAAPYLEEGNLADGQTLRQLERLLEGRTFMFALWVN